MTRAILIVLDDVGLDQLACYADVNQYAAPYAYAHTPTLDMLARDGVRFTQARAHPVCSPTRSALLTGCYPFRTGCGNGVKDTTISETFYELGNPTPVVALPSFLSRPTAWFGKGHLGLYPEDGGTFPEHARSLGFDEFHGMLANLGEERSNVGGPPGFRRYREWHISGKTSGNTAETEYATIHTQRLVARWISQHPDFQFAFVCFHAMHNPYVAASIPPVAQHGFGTIDPSHKNTIARAMLECFDYQLGLLLEHESLADDVYVFVIGDNGTPLKELAPDPGEPRYPTCHPLWQPGDDLAPISIAPYSSEHDKGTIYEQGVRVPLLVYGDGVEPGISHELVDSVDVFATICELLGASIPGGAGVDSISFADCLSGGWTDRHWSFSERFDPNGTSGTRTLEDRCYVREDSPHRWKVVRRMGHEDEFYNVSVDPLEETNLGTSHPEYAATADALEALLAP